MSSSLVSGPPSDPESSLSYAGWRVVAATFLMALFMWGFGLYGHSVFLAELQSLRGWPAVLIASGSTLCFLSSSVLMAFADEAFKRFGLRRIALGGLAALAASTSLLAVAETPLALYAAFLLMAVAWFGLGGVTISTILSQWFDRRRGLAISLALNGASSDGIIVAPALVFLVGKLGFTTAMLAMTAVMVAILLPAVLVVIGRPPPERATGRGATSEPATALGILWTRPRALKSFAFWSISAPFALALVAQVAFIVHQIAILEPAMGRAQAGLAVSIMTFMAIAGRLLLGLLIDRLDPRRASAASFLSQAAALLVIAQTREPPILILACAVYGLSVGNLITFPAIIVQREFPLGSFAPILGLSTAIGGTISALGPGLIGVLRDLSGDYAAALFVCIALKITAAIVVVLRRSPLDPD